MHIRRLATFLLGAWLSCSFMMILVRVHNVSGADRMVSAPSRAAARNVEILGATSARTFLRLHGEELNRWYMETWEWAQLGLGALLLAALLVGDRRHRLAIVLCSTMLVTVAAMRFAITPQEVWLGRTVELLRPERPSPFRARYATYQTAYTVAETVKNILGLMLLSSLLRQHERRRTEEEQRIKWVRAS